MDLTQTKLTRAEWQGTEIPIDEREYKILDMIHKGYHNVNIRINDNSTLLQVTKIEASPEIEYYLYVTYFHKDIQNVIDKYSAFFPRLKEFKVKTIAKQPKKADIIRLSNTYSNIDFLKDSIFEFIFFKLGVQSLQGFVQNANVVDKKMKSSIMKTANQKNGSAATASTSFETALYTLKYLYKKCSMQNKNKYVFEFIDLILQIVEPHIASSIANFLYNAHEFIEKNPYLMKYEDMTLYDHQKELFTVMKNHRERAKLILYIAPTATGKTLSPLGLSNEYRVIFICVARHVGLSLARSAISLEKKIAFAFGCETADDIRLHYFAASSYTLSKKTGTISKVDNSQGDKVEIMICDVQSYLPAMYYMLSFNDKSKIITYWDEPTITMDYDKHDLHATIHKNWRDNQIPNIVLSCATLPKEEEIQDTLMDYRARFSEDDIDVEIHTIRSFDTKKSISMIDKKGYSVLPHLLFRDWQQLSKSVQFLQENKTILRYLDLQEILVFIQHIAKVTEFYNDGVIPSIEQYFSSIEDITMNSIKQYYLEILNSIGEENWVSLRDSLNERKRKFDDDVGVDSGAIRRIQSVANVPTPRLNTNTQFDRIHSVDSIRGMGGNGTGSSAQHPLSGVLLTTTDACTITDGPAIYLTEDVVKIGNFLLKETKITESVMRKITMSIANNQLLQKKIDQLQQKIEDLLGKDIEKEKKMAKDEGTRETRLLTEQLETAKAQYQSVQLDTVYIPNTRQHQQVWCSRWLRHEKMVENAFLPSIDEESIKKIMGLEIVDNLKQLLLLGIGMFDRTMNTDYLEIVKKLAYNQQLFIIIASSDYIYGTNYQFCHGFLGKDLMEMTQQKIIQSIGRIGRNNIQQEYTVRVRDDALLEKLFLPMEGENKEAVNMCALFSSD